VVDAPELRRYFAVDRLADARVARTIEVARPLFPYSQKLWRSPEQNANVSLYLSRRPLPHEVFGVGRLATSKRIELLCLTVPTARVSLPNSDAMSRALQQVGESTKVFTTGSKRRR
jgi:hypothetical protein